MKPAILYAAKSTEDKRGSIPTQLADGRKLAADTGLEVVGEFQDEAASAFKGSRGKGLTDAMALCEAMVTEHGSCALLVQHSDRLARGDGKKAKHLIEYTLWALKSGVTIRSSQDPDMFPEGDYGLLMGAVGGLRNHEDSRRKGLAVKAGMKRTAERGKFVGGRRPYGYRYDATIDAAGKRQSRLVVVAEEAAIVRRIFAEYVAGRAQKQIAHGLNFDGVPTLTQTDVAQGRHKPGPRASASSSWHATTIKGILTKPLYVGYVTFNGEHYLGPEGQPTHEPVVERATWDEACALRSARESRGRPRGRRTVGKHLLTEGLLRCTCGAAMSPVTKPKKGGGGHYEVYACVKKLQHGKNACPTAQEPIPRELIDSKIYSYFTEIALDVEATRRMLTETATNKLAEFEALGEQAQSEVAKVEDALMRIERDYIAGKITPEQWARFEEKLNLDLEAARAQAERHHQQQALVQRDIEQSDAEAAIAEELTRLGQLVAGQVRDGSRSEVESFRATLQRLFVGFELTSPARPFGSGVLQGQVWSDATPNGEHPDNPKLALGDGYTLLPVVRRQVIDWDGDYSEGFPAVQRTALALSESISTRACPPGTHGVSRPT